MHQYAHILAAVLILALFVAIIIKMHIADVNATNKPEVKVCHTTCAYVNLHDGKVRTVEPGFAEFFLDGLFSKLGEHAMQSHELAQTNATPAMTLKRSPAKAGLQPEPV